MPFLRVIRDNRGYDTTYLMHWFQDSGRQRAKILYAFRSPSGTRVSLGDVPHCILPLSAAAEDGTPPPVGEPGEIVSSGPMMVPGYWNKPKETAGLRWQPEM